MIAVTGTNGSVKIGAVEVGAVAASGVTSWTWSEETTTSTSGPYVGDPAIEETPSGDKYNLKIEFDVTEGTDPGQNAFIAARASKVRQWIELETILGKKVTVPAGLVTKAELKLDPKGTQSLSVEASGVGAVDDGAAE
jgi:hypothetical protein